MVESGEEIFNVIPSEITRISDDQRLTINFFIKGKKHSIYYPTQADANFSAQMTDGYVPGIFAASGLQLQHDLAMPSPVNKWLDFFTLLIFE